MTKYIKEKNVSRFIKELNPGIEKPHKDPMTELPNSSTKTSSYNLLNHTGRWAQKVNN